MPIILATREAEIRRIEVLRQPRQTVCETLSQKYPTQKSGRVAQVAEGLPSKQALSLNAGTRKNKKGK
jgi:hypothetical protein